MEEGKQMKQLAHADEIIAIKCSNCSQILVKKYT